MRPASLFLAVLGAAALIGAALLARRIGSERPLSLQGATPDPYGRATPAPDPGRGARDRPELTDEPTPVTMSSAGQEPGPESAPAVASEPGARPEAALLFRVVDARTVQPLTTFEARLGQAFLRPLLDERGRIRHDFPDGRARFPGLIEAREGKNVQLLILARGYQELRVPELYVAPGHELDLGTLRLERAPRLTVRVLDELTGEPVPGARVSLIASGAPPAPEDRPPTSSALDPWSARTDLDGRVLLTSRPGEPVTLSVRHATHLSRDVELSLPLSEEHEETVRLQASAPR